MSTTTASLVFTQRQFDEYARLSGDDNPIHVDPVFSAGTRFGRTVAHGMHLFAMLQRVITIKENGPLRLCEQEFMFRGPTFTGEPYEIVVAEQGDGTLHEEVTSPDGIAVVSGVARIGDPTGTPQPAEPGPSSDAYKGIEVGMIASRTHTFSADDVADYVTLVNDPNPLFTGATPELPPGLLGGMVSWVLGVDLPGPGTNWLKQSYRFHEIVWAPATVTTTVTVTRLRSKKGLVNLANTCFVDDRVVVSGESLVLAVDTLPR
jgi:acyl dehydratase